MTTKTELNEAASIAQQVLAALNASIGGAASLASAQLNWMCGYLWENAANQLNAPNTPFFANLAACFDQALAAGGTYEQMDTVRQLAMNLAPVSSQAVAVANFSVRMALIEQSRILAATTFTSRPQIDGYIDLVNSSFGAAVDVAADNMDNVAYTSLIALRAAVVNDLSTRAIPLPEIVVMTFPMRLPALTLAQRVYQDASQADSIVAMNNVIHPAFCPTMLEMLSE